MTDQQIIEQIRADRFPRALDSLYRHFPVVRHFIAKNQGNEEDARDVFQDALVILCERIQDRKFTINKSIADYLIGVCRYRWYAVLRERKTGLYPLMDERERIEEAHVESYLERESRFVAIEHAIASLGENCAKLLKLFYYKKASMSSIAGEMGFSSENSAKTQKFKCLEQARKLAMKNWMNEQSAKS